jgi:hypothetical protein
MSDVLEFSAGRFRIICFTGGYPLRAELYAGEDIIRIDGAELKDLEHVLARMRTAMRKHYLRPSYRMENDAIDLE